MYKVHSTICPKYFLHRKSIALPELRLLPVASTYKSELFDSSVDHNRTSMTCVRAACILFCRPNSCKNTSKIFTKIIDIQTNKERYGTTNNSSHKKPCNCHHITNTIQRTRAHPSPVPPHTTKQIKNRKKQKKNTFYTNTIGMNGTGK